MKRLTYTPVQPSGYEKDTDVRKDSETAVENTKASILTSEVRKNVTVAPRRSGLYPSRPRKKTKFYQPESSFLAELCSESLTVSDALCGDESEQLLL